MQSRQAEKYRSLASSIRKAQALLSLISMADAQKAVLEAERALTQATAGLAELSSGWVCGIRVRCAASTLLIALPE